MPPPALLDLSQIDTTRLIATPDDIRKLNPHRFEMEHLDGVVYMDRENHLAVGFKEVRADEFWCRGHMPGFPLFPGVLMVEAAAQLTSFYAKSSGILDGLLGLGGVEDVRYRRSVRPGERLWLVGKGVRVHRRQTIFDTQGFVDGQMAFEARIIGVPIPGHEQVQAVPG